MVANTENDTENLLLCSIARKKYNVPRTVALINNPRYSWLFDEKFCVDVALDKSKILAGIIHEELSASDLVTLLNLRLGSYSIVEKRIVDQAPIIGKTIQEIALPDHFIFVAIFRNNAMIFPKGTTMLEVDDVVVVLTDVEGKEKLGSMLSA